MIELLLAGIVPWPEPPSPWDEVRFLAEVHLGRSSIVAYRLLPEQLDSLEVKEFCERFILPMLDVARRILGDDDPYLHDIVLAAVHDIFARFYANGLYEREFRDDDRLLAILTRAVANRAMSRLRRRRVERRDLQARADAVCEVSRDDDPAFIAIRNERSVIIREAFESLTANQQAVVARELDGMSHARIARDLRIPLGTVKTRLQAAHERLRMKLSPHFE